MNKKLKFLAAAVPAAGLIAGLAACGSTHTVTKTVPGPTTTHISNSGGNQGSAAVPAPSSSAPVTPSSAPSGPLGTAFTVTATNDAGSPSSYDVTAISVDQQAQLTPYETVITPGDHTVAVEFVLTGNTGQSSDDANSDAVVIGTDGQDYDPSFNNVSDGTNFNSGDFEVSAGQTVRGWVTFELPPGVQAASVQWSPDTFSGTQPGTWSVG